MWLDLSKVIEVPGASASFALTLDGEQLLGGGILSFRSDPEAEGKVVNTAGLLDLHASIRADARCRCDRCGREFDRVRVQTVDVPLAADLDEDTDSDQVTKLFVENRQQMLKRLLEETE